MLSDLHFDPLRDPGKTARLAAAPERDWPAILSAPASPDQASGFAAIQAKCGTRNGVDADFSLLTSALHAAAAQAPGAKFVTVSGDLVVHQFECRWKLASGSSRGYQDFAEKTASFVIHQVDAAFAGIPVYIALGNNDSSCGDYRMDLHDRYFAATAPAIVDSLLGTTLPARRQALADYQAGGYYTALIPGLPRTRLIAFDDLFLSRKYQTCAGKPDNAPAQSALLWLARQLDQARQRGEAVWLLAHIPPGVDVYSTVTKNRDVCAGEPPELFLAGDALATLLARYPDTIRFLQFGHTHSDEVRLIGDIPAKIIGSVTPINGNLPSFTVGQVDRKTARLADYRVYVAAGQDGTGPWASEYDYRETYAAPAFTAAALQKQIAAFRKDPDSASPTSRAYEQSFSPGSPSPLALIWPQAACALGNFTAASYRACACKAN